MNFLLPIWSIFAFLDIIILLLVSWLFNRLSQQNLISILVGIQVMTLFLIIQSILVPIMVDFESRRLISTNKPSIMRKSSHNKAKSKALYAVWTFQTWNYERELKRYFEEEKLLLERGELDELKRIINPSVISNAHIKDHCNRFKDLILNGSYDLVLAPYQREVLIFDHERVIIYEKSHLGAGVGIAIGPLTNVEIVQSHNEEFNTKFEMGRRLSDYNPRDGNFEQKVIEWLEDESTSRKEASPSNSGAGKKTTSADEGVGVMGHSDVP